MIKSICINPFPPNIFLDEIYYFEINNINNGYSYVKICDKEGIFLGFSWVKLKNHFITIAEWRNNQIDIILND